MTLTRKFALKIAALFLTAPLFALFLSCSEQKNEDLDEIIIGTPATSSNSSGMGNVRFTNESSYDVDIHLDHFSGFKIVEKLASGKSVSKEVSASNNYGIGTVFSLRFCNLLTDNLWACGIDPNAQITENIVSGGNYNILVSQPQNLEFSEAFLKILNTSNQDIELRRVSGVFKQENKDQIPIPSGQAGFYKINNIANSNNFPIEMENYTVWQTLASFNLPVFTANKGYIYEIEFKEDGSFSTIVEQSLIF